jgi:hypothetical protein
MMIRTTMWVAILGGLLFTAANGRTESGPQSLTSYFSGYRFELTFREQGRPIYGTHTFAVVDFCPSGRYLTAGRNIRRTVLDNEQVTNWTDSGAWEVADIAGAPMLRYVSQSGDRNSVALLVGRDGRVSLANGATLNRIGRAACR